MKDQPDDLASAIERLRPKTAGLTQQEFMCILPVRRATAEKPAEQRVE